MIVARLKNLCIDMNKLDESPSAKSAVSVFNHWLTFLAAMAALYLGLSLTH